MTHDQPSHPARSTEPEILGTAHPPAGPGGGRRKVVAIVAAVVLTMGVAVAVGVVVWNNERAAQERAEAAAERREAREAKEAREAREAAAHAAAVERHQMCTKQLRGLMSALQVVDARLDVGLTQSALSDLVGKVSIAYNRLDPHDLEGDCLSAGAKLESAFSAYNRTVSTWNDCIFDYGCDVDSHVLPGMQRAWAKASRAIDKAERLVDQLDPDSSAYRDTASSST